MDMLPYGSEIILFHQFEPVLFLFSDILLKIMWAKLNVFRLEFYDILLVI